MRKLPALLLLLAGTGALGQTGEERSLRTPFTTTPDPAWLGQVLPEAVSFTEKSGEPPVFTGYGSDGEPAGYVFLSSDVPPEEKGYSAPLLMLIGMDQSLHITGFKVLDYRESFRYSRGDFVADPAFLSQFTGKPVTDEFRLRHDVDGLSGATLTSYGIARGMRESARRVASAYLDYVPGDERQRRSDANAGALLSAYDWQQLKALGFIRETVISMPVGEMTLAIAYMGRPVLGNFLVGEEDYAEAQRSGAIRQDSQEMMLLAVGGNASSQFRMERLAVSQGDGPPISVNPRAIASAGSADTGAISGQAAFAGALVLDESFDVTQPFSVLYRAPGSIEPVAIPYDLSSLPLALALARDEYIPSPQELARQQLLQSGFLARLAYGPPWANDAETDTPWRATPWRQTLLLAGLLALCLWAFIGKREPLRWATLAVTLGYLGFINGGFLSVSHITAVMNQGVAPILNNLPLLLLVTFTLVSTLVVGRLFCGSLCPFGALQDFITRLVPRHLRLHWQKLPPPRLHRAGLWLKYLLLGLILLAAMTYGEISIFQYFEPFGTLFFRSGSPLLWGLLVLILAGAVVIPRFYCRYLCPLGAALGIVSLAAPLRIRRVPQCQVCRVCEQACPTGAIHGERIDFKECVRCDVCEVKLLRKAGSCRHDMAEIRRRLEAHPGGSLIVSDI